MAFKKHKGFSFIWEVRDAVSGGYIHATEVERKVIKMFYKCPKCSFCKPVLDVEKIIDIRNSVSSEEIEAITSPITIIGIGTYKVLEEFQKASNGK
jgi:hypothetical protein